MSIKECHDLGAQCFPSSPGDLVLSSSPSSPRYQADVVADALGEVRAPPRAGALRSGSSSRWLLGFPVLIKLIAETSEGAIEAVVPVYLPVDATTGLRYGGRSSTESHRELLRLAGLYPVAVPSHGKRANNFLPVSIRPTAHSHHSGNVFHVLQLADQYPLPLGERKPADPRHPWRVQLGHQCNIQ